MADARPAAGRVLATALSAGGVAAAYGRPLSGLPLHPVAEPRVALLLAHAHRAVHHAPAVAHLGDGRLVVAGRRAEGGPALALPVAELDVHDAADLAALPPVVTRAAAGDGLVLRVAFDPDAPATWGTLAEADAPPAQADADQSWMAGVAIGRVVVLAGPGVMDASPLSGLHSLAAAGRLGVLNTWGAKGVFHWQSPHHLATAGLQERDFELGGLDGADLVLAVGLDEREAPAWLWSHYPHLVIAPESLSALAAQWPAFSAFPATAPLRSRLAQVTQAGWSSTSKPLAPSRVTQHYAQALGDAGLVAADPGGAGFWVARTFATTRPASVLVPAAAVQGWAAACVLAARLAAPLRRALAVVDGPLDELTRAVLEVADRSGVAVGVEVWDEGGEALEPDHHRSRLEELVASGGVASLATNFRQLDEFVAVAGPVRAWTGDETGP